MMEFSSNFLVPSNEDVKVWPRSCSFVDANNKRTRVISYVVQIICQDDVLFGMPKEYTRAEWIQLGKFMQKCKSLQGVVIHNALVTETPGFELFIPYLGRIPTLKALTFERVPLHGERITLLLQVLEEVKIVKLRLFDCSIRNEHVAELLDKSKNAHNFVELDLPSNNIGGEAYRAIAEYFRRGPQDLVKMDLQFNTPVFEDDAKFMVDSLAQTKLRSICFSPSEGFLNAVPNLITVVGDSSSIESLCNSNHVLRNIGPATWGMRKKSELLDKALDINSLGMRVEDKIRCKIRLFYLQVNFDVEPLLSLGDRENDVESSRCFMPNLLEFVTLSEEVFTKEYGTRPYHTRNGKLTDIFHFVKNTVCALIKENKTPVDMNIG